MVLQSVLNGDDPVDENPPELFVRFEGEVEAMYDLEQRITRAYKNDNEVSLLSWTQLVEGGTVEDADGNRLRPRAEERAKRQILDPLLHPEARTGRRLGGRIHDGEQREIIEGVQLAESVAMLDGPPKTGKTTFCAALTGALAGSDARDFLGHRVLLTENERDRGIVYFSTEGNSEALERAMLAQVGEKYAHRVQMIHTAEMGGPTALDLTDETVFQRMADLLTPALNDGRTMPPIYVIFDNVTAVAAALGQSAVDYGPKWVAQALRLLKTVGVPNALIVTHSPQGRPGALGGTEMSAPCDALWSLSGGTQTNPNAARRFSIRSRVGGTDLLPIKLRLVDGSLSVDLRAGKPEDDGTPEEQENSAETADYSALMLGFALDHHEQTGEWPTNTQLRRSKVPQAEFASVRDDLVESGQLIRVKLQNRGGGSVFQVSEEGGSDA